MSRNISVPCSIAVNRDQDEMAEGNFHLFLLHLHFQPHSFRDLLGLRNRFTEKEKSEIIRKMQ